MSEHADAADEGDRDKSIAELADAHGFPLANVDDAGEVLILEPTSLEALPGPERLQALAAALKDGGYRYVTFAADGLSAPPLSEHEDSP